MSTTVYNQKGSAIFPTAKEDLTVSDNLPVGTYTIMIDQMKGYYLSKIQDINVNEKIYGSVNKNIDRIINTFFDRPNNTGVLLQGDKGSGKTLLAKLLSIALRKTGVSTIVINEPLYGEEFNKFLASIKEPCLILFDEYEKVYADYHRQNALLTLFDGVFDSKKLFVVTTNSTQNISSYFKNRPGRFFYVFEYKGLDTEFIKEYCEDCLKDKSQIDPLIKFSSLFSSFSFDILKAFVEEMNRYNESVQDVSKFLNAIPTEQFSVYKIDKIIYENPGFKIDTWDDHLNEGVPINPFLGGISLCVFDKEDNEKYFYLEPKDIIEFSPEKMILRNKEVEVHTSKEKSKGISPVDFLRMVSL